MMTIKNVEFCLFAKTVKPICLIPAFKFNFFKIE